MFSKLSLINIWFSLLNFNSSSFRPLLVSFFLINNLVDQPMTRPCCNLLALIDSMSKCPNNYSERECLWLQQHDTNLRVDNALISFCMHLRVLTQVLQLSSLFIFFPLVYLLTGLIIFPKISSSPEFLPLICPSPKIYLSVLSCNYSYTTHIRNISFKTLVCHLFLLVRFCLQIIFQVYSYLVHI